MKTQQKIIISSLLLFGSFLLVLPAQAVDWPPIVPCGREGTPACQLCHLWQLVSNIINFVLFSLATPAAILLFVASGIIFLTSAGSEDRITLAKRVLTNAIVGIAIMFASWLIVGTLINTLAAPDEAGQVIMAWNQFPGCE